MGIKYKIKLILSKHEDIPIERIRKGQKKHGNYLEILKPYANRNV